MPSLRVALILCATAVWSMVIVVTAEAYLSTHSAILVALFVGAVAALIASHCADYDHKRSRTNG